MIWYRHSFMKITFSREDLLRFVAWLKEGSPEKTNENKLCRLLPWEGLGWYRLTSLGDFWEFYSRFASLLKNGKWMLELRNVTNNRSWLELCYHFPQLIQYCVQIFRPMINTIVAFTIVLARHLCRSNCPVILPTWFVRWFKKIMLKNIAVV